MSKADVIEIEGTVAVSYTHLGFEVKDGKKVRVAKATGKVID